MTAVLVVEESAIAALSFNEPEAEAVAGRTQGAWLVAPALLDFELANVCVSKMRHHPEQRDQLLAAFALRRRLRIEHVEVGYAGVGKLAQRCDFRLKMSREAGAGLVTLDRRLADSPARSVAGRG